VAAYLVPRIREVPPKSSTLTGGIASQYIQYLTKPKAYGQILSVSDGRSYVRRFKYLPYSETLQQPLPQPLQPALVAELGS